MTAIDRIRQYLSRNSSWFLRPSLVATTTTAAATNTANRRNTRVTTATSSTAPRRRLQRGWWPDAQKRAERSFKAMEDLKEETFLITEGNLEWVFGVTEDENNESGRSEPQCHLILPSELTSVKCHLNHKQHNQRTSNECAICMVEYDIGDVVIHSKNCSHAFHQDCILDWVSRDNRDCPSCRAIFYNPNDGSETKKSSSRSESSDAMTMNDETDSNNINDNSHRRSRSDTADTDVLSEYDMRSRGPSFDGADHNYGLESVVENDIVESVAA
eukprot:CAMPEP_0172315630 /NCGR_PEP_ID=MMETSP1058-20130122/25814_1 /TAXON_ID=83371 /ORGANISM="Detonula confervacea, Strain CCMP 353" /LENGTH=271 /DNA_ID=CAMNT_0013029749 /DNA_START=57 /DNA_END=872 /DNA_ORIENTATION=+